MGLNKFLPHVMVLPEDEADRQLANGFYKCIDPARQGQLRILTPAGGWSEALKEFKSEHAPMMDRFPQRLMVLVIHYDGVLDRQDRAKACIPEQLQDRVFIIGVAIEPQDLGKGGMGLYEDIGAKLATDCREQTRETWNHQQLRHNSSELDRLFERVRPILF
jgi:hypothetical protein